MGVTVGFLEVKDFRNYEWFLLELSQGMTIISGENATGKTNLVEALQILTVGESFRSFRWDDVVRHGATTARVSMVAHGDGRELSVVMDMERGLRRQYHINGAKKRSVSAATGSIPSVLFTPDDLLLVKGASEARRNTVDALGSQMSTTYDSLRKDYARTIRQKNALLKENRPASEIDPWSEAVASIGAKLMTHREGLLGRLMKRFQDRYSDVSGGETAEIIHVPSWKREELSFPEETENYEELLHEAITSLAGSERSRGMSLIGPHRDDIKIRIGGADARTFASQGQQRTAVLAWKMAEVGVIEEVMGQQPLLLLDDVMSELDQARREQLIALVEGSVQTVVTTTNLHYFSERVLASSKVVTLDAGP